MKDFRSYLNEQLQDPEFKKEYDALEGEFAIIQALIDARHAAGLTQKELSAKTGIAQGDISKLERGTGTLSADAQPSGRRHGNASARRICPRIGRLISAPPIASLSALRASRSEGFLFTPAAPHTTYTPHTVSHTPPTH